MDYMSLHYFLTIPLQLQLTSLKEKKERNDQIIDTLQKTIEQKELEIQHLLQQLAAKESELKQQTKVLDAVEFNSTQLWLEVDALEMKKIQLEHERDNARVAVNLAQEEAHYYAEALLRASKVYLSLCMRN